MTHGKSAIDTMPMVREIRDRINEETSHMTLDERIAYVRSKGTEAKAKFREVAEGARRRNGSPQD